VPCVAIGELVARRLRAGDHPAHLRKQQRIHGRAEQREQQHLRVELSRERALGLLLVDPCDAIAVTLRARRVLGELFGWFEGFPQQEAHPLGIELRAPEQPPERFREVAEGFGEVTAGAGPTGGDHLAVEALFPAEVMGDQLLAQAARAAIASTRLRRSRWRRTPPVPRRGSVRGFARGCVPSCSFPPPQFLGRRGSAPLSSAWMIVEPG